MPDNRAYEGAPMMLLKKLISAELAIDEDYKEINEFLHELQDKITPLKKQTKELSLKKKVI